MKPFYIKEKWYSKIIALIESLDVKIRFMENNDLEEIYDNLENIYHKSGKKKEEIIDKWLSDADVAISIVATVDNKLAGFYFLGDTNIPRVREVDYKNFENLKGVEGVALGVFKPYLSLGIGKKLIQYTEKNLNADYIWGYQLKSLENIDHWLKRRELYVAPPWTTDDGYTQTHLYITYKMLR